MSRHDMTVGRIEQLTTEARQLANPLPLFDRFTKPAAPFAKNSDTSVAAAEQIAPSAATLRRKVLECVRSGGVDGRTREEIETLTGIKGSTVRPRVLELIASGEIYESAFHVRNASSGRKAAVLLATVTR